MTKTEIEIRIEKLAIHYKKLADSCLALKWHNKKELMNRNVPVPGYASTEEIPKKRKEILNYLTDRLEKYEDTILILIKKLKGKENEQ